MIFDEIFNFMLCELIGIVNFDDLVIKCCFNDGKILVCYDLWITTRKIIFTYSKNPYIMDKICI